MSKYELTQPIGEDDRATALAFAEESLEPASEEFVIAELGRLRALTISRDIGQDLALVFAAYADELVRYPGDAVREVLRAWPKTEGGKWWPSMAELETRLNQLVAPRKTLRDALKRGYEKPQTWDDWAPPTEEERREVVELLEKNGVKLDERGRVKKFGLDPITPEELRKANARMNAELAEFRARWNANLEAAKDTAP